MKVWDCTFAAYNFTCNIYSKMKSALRIMSALAIILILGPFTLNAQNEALQRGNFAIGSGVGYVNSGILFF